MPHAKVSKTAKKTRKCPTCGKLSKKDGHLCVLTKSRDKKCDYCDALIPDERYLRNAKIRNLSYICNTCGRTAIRRELLCKPKKIR